MELHIDGLFLSVGVSLKSVPSGLDLSELNSMLWGVEFMDSSFQSSDNLHSVDSLVVLILLELDTELLEWSFKPLHVSPDLSLSLLDLLVDLWVHGNLPHLETFVVPVEVSLEFSIKGLPFLANGFELSLVFWVAKKATSLLKSLADFMELSFDFFGKLLKFLADLWVLIDELVDILLNDFVVGNDLLVFFVVHGKLPHFETLSVPFEGSLDLKVESLHFGNDLFKLFFIFWGIEHLAGLLKSNLELAHLVVEDLDELLGFLLDLWVIIVEFLHLLSELLVLSGDLLVLIVVHGDGPQRLGGLWGFHDLAGGADGTSDEHHDCKFHFVRVCCF